MTRTPPLAAVLLSVMTAAASADVPPPAPVGPTPSARQLVWHDLRAYAFVHFSINTFTDREWGYGDEPPDRFAPTDFSADQIVGVAKRAGLAGVVLTCKHHDGFCLWPSRYTDHTVRRSPWRGGRGDVVREVSDACRRAGLEFGVYLSPWDRHSADYGRPEYLPYYRNQLAELLTNYGPIFEVWLDGANGGDGYYGGGRQTRRIDNRTYYDWPTTIALVRRLQPDACIFSDAGPDVRWAGNEDGTAGDPCWATLDPAGLFPGHADPAHLNRGDRPGTDWLPAECDTSIRPGWFYHPAEDARVKSVAALEDTYYASVGRGANLILNLPPDRRGRIPDADAAVLAAWRDRLDGTFATNLAATATSMTADHVRGPAFGPANLTSLTPDHSFAADDDNATATIEFTWSAPVTFDVVRLSEVIRLGQRVDRAVVETWAGGRWHAAADVRGIGPRRLIRLTSPLTTARLRLRIASGSAAPALYNFGLFRRPPT